MGALIRDAAARFIKGHAIDTPNILSITNTQRRLLADLGKPARSAMEPGEYDDWSDMLDGGTDG